MKQEELNDKALHEIFKRISENPSFEDLQAQIMQKVYRVQKKKEIRNLIVVSLTSAVMFAFAVYILTYYLAFDLTDTFVTVIKGVAVVPFEGFSPFIFTVLPFLLLLWIDHRFRKRFRQNESGQ